MLQFNSNSNFISCPCAKSNETYAMKTEISISGLSRVMPESYSIESDDQIPISAGGCGKPIGIKGYIELKKQSSLLEFSIDSEFMAIWDVVLMSFDSIYYYPRADFSLPRIPGLPIIRLNEKRFKEESPYFMPYMSISQAFSVSLDCNFLEIDFGNLAQARHIIASGPLEFYVDASMNFLEKDYGDDPWNTERIAAADLVDHYAEPASLCGLCVTGLQEKQLEILRTYHFSQDFQTTDGGKTCPTD